MKRITIIIFISIFIINTECQKGYDKFNPSNCGTKFSEDAMNYSTLLKKWDLKDSCYIFNYIKSLSDTSISDCTFSDRHADLLDILKFRFCAFECFDDSKSNMYWTTRSKEERLETRSIIAKAWLEYANSRLFMKIFTSETYACSAISLRPFCDAKLLYDEELLTRYRKALDQIYLDCK